MRRISSGAAQRIALAAQGFAEPRPNGRVDVRHFRRVMDRVGTLQLDSVNVIARSHYLPVLARLGHYDTKSLDRYTSRSGELFEYWGHMASLLPSRQYRLFRWRMESRQPWQSVRTLAEEHPDYIEQVFRDIVERGPLRTSDLDDAGTRTGPWWGYARGKHALEWLFTKGRITGYRDKNFHRVYDLPERVIPQEHYDAAPLGFDAAYRELLLKAAKHHGIGTAKDLADYYRLHVPTARPILSGLVKSGRLDEVEVDGWRGPTYVHPDARRPQRVGGSALLSPFDSLVWDRDRTERLFGFHYRIEIYVPKPKRVYGYYVLPYLLDGRLVARIDLKAHRKDGFLEVRGAFVEPSNDPKTVASALKSDLEIMTTWLGLEGIKVVNHGDLAPAIARVL